jgi:hypothetical protein
LLAAVDGALESATRRSRKTAKDEALDLALPVVHDDRPALVFLHRDIVPDFRSARLEKWGLSLTVTCSVISPISSAKLTVSVCATRRITLSASEVRNPGALTRILYVPDGTYGSVYAPADVQDRGVAKKFGYFDEQVIKERVEFRRLVL